MRPIILIAHDIRSAHNVGSLLRTADGLGVEIIYFTGYTPYPKSTHDSRLPHVAKKIDESIHKTALGAEHTVKWKHEDNVMDALTQLQADGYALCALEQTKHAMKLNEFNPPNKCALLLGSEVTGIQEDLLAACQTHLVIPMFGKKESFNVTQAAAMAMYHIRFSA